MTVESTISKSGPYAGAGSAGPFPVDFRFLDQTHLRVILTSTIGIDSDLILTTDYTVAGVGDPTGSVTLTVPLATGEKLTIVRNVPLTQEADYVQNDAFPAQSHENAIDKLTMSVQQQQERIDSALTLPPTVSGISTQLPVPSPNNFIGWNPTATGLQNIDPVSLVTSVVYGTARSDLFNGDGVSTNFVLTANPGGVANLDVSIGGVTQRPNIDYSWSGGTTISFTTAPPVGSNNILCRYLLGLPQGYSDSASSLFVQAGAGAVNRTAQNKMRDVISAADFGVIPGGAGTTAALNAAILTVSNAGGGTILVNRGNYTGMGKIFMRSNVSLVFEPGCVVRSAPGIFGVNDRFINFDSISGWSFDGGNSLFCMNQGEYTSGEQRHIFFFVNASDGEIKNVVAQDSGGDGVYFGRSAGAGTHCKRIKWSGIRTIRSRRNGASVVSVDGLTGHGFSFEDTAGTAPQYGLCFEPNDSDDELRGIVMTGVRTSGNVGGGVIAALSNFGLTAKKSIGISVNGLTSTDDGNVVPNAASAGLSIAGASGFTWQNEVRGPVQFDNVLIVRPKGTAVRSTNFDSTKGPIAKIRNVVAIDVGFGAPANNEDKCGLTIVGTNIGGRNFGAIDVENMKVYDTRGAVGTYSPVYIYSIAGGTGVGIVQGMRLKDVIGVGFTPTSGRGHVSNNSVDFDQSSITYTDEQTVGAIAVNDPTITKSYAGYTIYQTGGGTVELPTSNNNRGLSWFFDNVDGSTIIVKPNAADFIKEALTVSNSLVLGLSGARAQFTATGSNRVRVDRMTPLANRPLGFIVPGRVVYSNAAPVTGAWTPPDIVINATPAVGGIAYWQNISPGSPGTFSPVGIVGATQCAHQGTTSGATLAALETNVNAIINALIACKLMA